MRRDQSLLTRQLCWATILGLLASLGLHCSSSDTVEGAGGAGNSTGGSAVDGSAGANGDSALDSRLDLGAAGAGGSAGTGASAGTAGSPGTGGSIQTGGNGGIAGNLGGAAGTTTGGAGGSSGGAGSGGIPGPLGAAGAWTLLFQDEFEGPALDLTKWHPNWFGATDGSVTPPINDLEVSCYDPAQVAVNAGVLELTAISATKAECVKKDGTPAQYASGMIMSDGLYNFVYGFVEARLWLPPGMGTPENWSAFWLNGEEWPQDGEIDILETLGGGSASRWTYHYDSDVGAGVTHSELTAPTNNLLTGAGWHVFGAQWQPDSITFYYDGVNVGEITSAGLQGGAKVTSSAHYIIINYGLNGNYTVVVPSTLKVDYVRHWEAN